MLFKYTPVRSTACAKAGGARIFIMKIRTMVLVEENIFSVLENLKLRRFVCIV